MNPTVRRLFALILLQTAGVLAVEISVEPEGISVKVDGEVIPGTAVKIDVPKEFQNLDLDKLETIDPSFVDVLKVISDREYEDSGEASCVATFRKMSLKGLPAINACMQEMQLTVGKIRKRLKEILPCMVRCIGTKMNVFNEDGTFNADYTQDLIHSGILPPRLKGVAVKIFDTCFSHASDIKANDPKCNTYRPVMKCVVESAFKMADEVLELCPDIPEVFKKAARRMINSHRVRKMIDRVIDPKDDY